jgi:hypothetical protein
LITAEDRSSLDPLRGEVDDAVVGPRWPKPETPVPVAVVVGGVFVEDKVDGRTYPTVIDQARRSSSPVSVGLTSSAGLDEVQRGDSGGERPEQQPETGLGSMWLQTRPMYPPPRPPRPQSRPRVQSGAMFPVVVSASIA